MYALPNALNLGGAAGHAFGTFGFWPDLTGTLPTKTALAGRCRGIFLDLTKEICRALPVRFQEELAIVPYNQLANCRNGG